MDVQRTLEHDLELLCLTGVEDKLQVLACESFLYFFPRVTDFARARRSESLAPDLIERLLLRLVDVSVDFAVCREWYRYHVDSFDCSKLYRFYCLNTKTKQKAKKRVFTEGSVECNRKLISLDLRYQRNNMLGLWLLVFL